MPEIFFSYLNNERDRLGHALAAARSAQVPNVSEIACLQRQQRIVEDQLARWASDLADAVTAA
jgi:hypothetical protein